VNDGDDVSEAEQTQDAASVDQRQIDRVLLSESRRYNVPYAAYSAMSPRERGAYKARWTHQLRLEAKRRGLDPAAFVEMSDDEREEARASNPEQTAPRAKKTRTSIEDVLTERYGPVEDPPPVPRTAPVHDPSLTDGDPDEPALPDDEPHSPMDAVPAEEDDPRNRSKPTIGAVFPDSNEDLVGWKQPRNLRDVYARFTIGDGQHFIRVERKEPKAWLGVATSGYMGEIRVPITEEEFADRFGGSVYLLQVYGPDPRGRQDPVSGQPLIKPKTEPFMLTVPGPRPPLIFPAHVNQAAGDRKMQPFPPGYPMAPTLQPPTNAADAQMHKSTLDFVNSASKRADDLTIELLRRAGDGGGTKEALHVVADTQKAALEQQRLQFDSERRAAETRENALREQLNEQKAEMRRLAEKFDTMTQQNAQAAAQNNPFQGAIELTKAVSPGKVLEEQLADLKDRHRDEIATLKDNHKEALTSLKERHDEELRRMRERLDEVEKRARDRGDEQERRFRERETELRAQADQQRRDDREASDRRVADTVTRFEDRLKDIKDQHARELRMQEGQHVTRTDTSKSAYEMQLANTKEKIQRLEGELEEAKADAADAKDPVTVLNKAKEQAEAMGYHKDDDEPKTGWDRFLATAGTGIGKFFENADQWVPKVLAREPQSPRMLPQNMPQRPAQPQPRPAPSRRAAVAWATQDSVPVAGQRPHVPPSPGVQVEPQQQPQPAQAAPPQPQQQAAPPEGPQQQPQGPAPEQQPAAPTSYSPVFPDEWVVGFRSQIEQAMTAGMEPDQVAMRMVASFPEPSHVLISSHKASDVIDIVKRMPNGGESIITSRDGKKWIEKLWVEIGKQIQRLQAEMAQQQQQPASAPS